MVCIAIRYNVSMNVDGKKMVLLGVTGSIAAYKACELVRLYQKAGLEVKVIMTEHALKLVGAATFRALTGNPVSSELFDAPGNPINHISLAQEADVFVIAPATANVLNKLANGIGDDLLTTTALACTAPLLVAPAMNVDMLNNPITQASLQQLDVNGVTIIGPGDGYLACGTEDSGRMSEPEEICTATLLQLQRKQSLAGKRVLITAGPTREFLDPVRFISSPSSGRTGFAIAREAASRGADVVLVSGPTDLLCPKNIEYLPVVTAEQMLEQASKHFDAADIAIFSAAVADYKPAVKATQKIKKERQAETSAQTSNTDSSPDPVAAAQGESQLELHVKLIENPDILATLAARRNATASRKPYIVGFAAETENILANAQAKLRAKGADLIIANDVSDPQTGFASEQNQICFVSPGASEQTQLLSKDLLAGLILDRIQQEL